jgi:hypothetical protein
MHGLCGRSQQGATVHAWPVWTVAAGRYRPCMACVDGRSWQPPSMQGPTRGSCSVARPRRFKAAADQMPAEASFFGYCFVRLNSCPKVQL